uniref:Ig-like domain-containing protein n=1 Tax=Leptobrachium leishanense TaxID=445787 RepID=A0A8C5Q9E4_9ANUR
MCHRLCPPSSLFPVVLSGTCLRISFQPFDRIVFWTSKITLQCNYQTTALQPPIVQWKYKSFCRDRIADAFSSNSQDAQINNQLQQANPGYNPYVECQDSARTVRTVATKQGNTVTLGDFYQGRRITVDNLADLTIDMATWGDGGVYYCTVISGQDLQGNNEGYTELLVLGENMLLYNLNSLYPVDLKKINKGNT